MEDYERTVELVGYAQDSAGQSALQFSKTLEGFEAKLNQLQAAWEKLYTNFLNSQFFKDAIDGITGIVNRLSEMPPLLALILGLVSVTIIKNIALNALSGLKTISKGVDDLKTNFTAVKTEMQKPIRVTFTDNLDELSARVAAAKAGGVVPPSIGASVEDPSVISLPSAAKTGLASTIKKTVSSAATSGLLMGLTTGLATGDVETGVKAGIATALFQGLTSSAAIGAAKAGLGAIGTFLAANPVVIGAALATAVVAGLGYAVYKATDKQEQLKRAVEQAEKKYQKELTKLEEDRNRVTEKSNTLKDFQALRKEYEELSSKIVRTAEEQQAYNDLISQIEEQQPSLIEGYDEMGNAIIASADSWDRIVGFQKESLRLAKEQSALQLIATASANYDLARAKVVKVTGGEASTPEEARSLADQKKKAAEAGKAALQEAQAQDLLKIFLDSIKDTEDPETIAKLQEAIKAEKAGTGFYKDLILDYLMAFGATYTEAVAMYDQQISYATGEATVNYDDTIKNAEETEEAANILSRAQADLASSQRQYAQMMAESKISGLGLSSDITDLLMSGIALGVDDIADEITKSYESGDINADVYQARIAEELNEYVEEQVEEIEDWKNGVKREGEQDYTSYLSFDNFTKDLMEKWMYLSKREVEAELEKVNYPPSMERALLDIYESEYGAVLDQIDSLWDLSIVDRFRNIALDAGLGEFDPSVIYDLFDSYFKTGVIDEEILGQLDFGEGIWADSNKQIFLDAFGVALGEQKAEPFPMVDIVGQLGLDKIVEIYRNYPSQIADIIISTISGMDVSDEIASLVASADYTSISGLDSLTSNLVQQGMGLEEAKKLVISTYNNLVNLGGENFEAITDSEGNAINVTPDDLLSVKTMNEYMLRRKKVTNSATKAIEALNTVQVLNEEQIEALLKDYPELTVVIERFSAGAMSAADASAILTATLGVTNLTNSIDLLKSYVETVKALQEAGVGADALQYRTAIEGMASVLSVTPETIAENWYLVQEAVKGNYKAFAQLFDLIMANNTQGALKQGLGEYILPLEEAIAMKPVLDSLGATIEDIGLGTARVTIPGADTYDGLLLKAEKYEMTLDKQYNLLEKIALIERSRKSLDNQLKLAKNADEYNSIIEQQIKLLNMEKDSQTELASARRREMYDLIEDNKLSTASTYASYDYLTGSVYVDTAGIETLGKQDPEAAKEAADYAEKMKAIAAAILEADEATATYTIDLLALEEAYGTSDFLDSSEIAGYVAGLNNELSTIDSITKSLGKGMDLTGSQVDDLIGEFPELVDELIDYSKGLKTAEELQNDMYKALSNKGLKNMLDFWETNLNAIKENKEGSEAYTQAIQNLANTLGFSYEDAVANLDLFESAVGGSVEALRELQVMAATPIIQPYLVEGQAEVDFSSLVNGLAITEAGAEKVRALLSSMGLTIEYKTVKYTVTTFEGGGSTGIGQPVETQLSATIPIVKLADASAVNNYRSSSGGGGGGGGGGGSSKKWENDYDKQYNLLQKINAELRKREKLERDIEDASSPEEVAKNLEEQRKNITGAESDYTKLLAARQKEMEQALKDNKKLQKYATYDSKTGQIIIDWGKINKVKDTKTGTKIDDYIKLLEDIQSKINEAADGIEEQKELLEQLNEAYRSEYLELEQNVYDAILEREQEVIDNLSSIDNSINDANDRLIDSITKEIDKLRQQRENERTEDDIADKMRRLTLLQRDTSGAYALEIKQLQDEIEKSQEDYTDTLIDQLISDMQSQFELSSEERERNIEMLQNQKDWRAETGFFWAQALALLGGNEDTLRAFIMRNDPTYAGLSPEAQTKYLEDFIQRYNVGLGWYLNQFGQMPSFDTGGLVSYTGGAQVHGSPKAPELVLNATDTKNFLVLKDVLNDFLKERTGSDIDNSSSSNIFYVEILNNIDQISDDYSVDRMINKMKQDIVEQASYRGVNVVIK